MNNNPLQCDICTSVGAVEKDGYYLCVNCGNKWEKESAGKVVKIIAESEQIKLGNARRELLKAVFEDKVEDIQMIMYWCNIIIYSASTEDYLCKLIQSYYLLDEEKTGYKNYLAKALTTTNRCTLEDALKFAIDKVQFAYKAETVDYAKKLAHILGGNESYYTNKIDQKIASQKEIIPSDIFLCYEPHDVEVAKSISNMLEENDVTCFCAALNLHHKRQEAITYAIKTCKCIVVLSSAYSKTGDNIAKNQMRVFEDLRGNAVNRVEVRIDSSADNAYFNAFFTNGTSISISEKDIAITWLSVVDAAKRGVVIRQSEDVPVDDLTPEEGKELEKLEQKLTIGLSGVASEIKAWTDKKSFNAKGWWLQFLVDAKVKSSDEIALKTKDFNDNKYYKLAIKYASKKEKECWQGLVAIAKANFVRIFGIMEQDSAPKAEKKLEILIENGKLKSYKNNKSETIKVSEEVTSIADSVFSGDVNLQQLEIGANVSKIGSNAVKWCDNLTSIVISADASDDVFWFATANSDYSGGEQMDVSDPIQNAKNFKGTYKDYYWYKKKIEKPEPTNGPFFGFFKSKKK